VCRLVGRQTNKEKEKEKEKKEMQWWKGGTDIEGGHEK
jgi:hypothetical protein